MWMLCVSICLLSGSTRRVNTRPSDCSPEEAETLETHTSARLVQSLILPLAVWTSVNTLPRSPLCPGVKGKGERGRYEGLTRGRKETVDFFEYQFDSYVSRLSTPLIVYVSVLLHNTVCVCSSYSVCIQYFTACINANSAAKRAVRTLSVSLDESACCLLKLLLEQQQSLSLWVPVCLISCCHFSSCSLVNHLSRSPLCAIS